MNAILKISVVFICSLSVCSAASAALSDDSAERPIPVRVDGEPYTFPYHDPLYGTLAGYLSISKISVPGDRVMKLHPNGFASSVPVHAVIQDGRAPLAIVLLGIGGRADADFSRLWPSWFAEAGYHVLFFDSTFRAPYMNMAPKGPSGNLWAEADTVRDIIDAFLNHPDVQGKVDGIGITGMSYGGVQALILGQMAQEGKLPFTVNAIQAYSPPVNLARTAQIFDRWYKENRWCYTLVELATKVGKHKPESDDAYGAPFSPSMMRAAISLSFREELADVVIRSDEKFKMNRLPKGDLFNDTFIKKENAEAWNFNKYIYDLALPYWQQQIGQNAVGKLVFDTELCELLKTQPAYSETIVALDDPFNAPEDLDDLKHCAEGKRVTFLPTGGHLGYVGDEWTRTHLMTMFNQPHRAGTEKGGAR